MRCLVRIFHLCSIYMMSWYDIILFIYVFFFVYSHHRDWNDSWVEIFFQELLIFYLCYFIHKFVTFPLIFLKNFISKSSVKNLTITQLFIEELMAMRTLWCFLTSIFGFTALTSASSVCPDGWWKAGDICYIVSQSRMPWYSAQEVIKG